VPLAAQVQQPAVPVEQQVQLTPAAPEQAPAPKQERIKGPRL